MSFTLRCDTCYGELSKKQDDTIFVCSICGEEFCLNCNEDLRPCIKCKRDICGDCCDKEDICDDCKE